jgi:hypothetical protein
MSRRSSAVLNETDLKAAKSFDKLLAGHLVKATELRKSVEHYGIVIPFEKIKKELKKNASSSESEEWKNCIWAIWCDSIEKAIEYYESIDEEKFIPITHAGELTFLSPRFCDFEILDLEDNLKEIYSEIYNK